MILIEHLHSFLVQLPPTPAIKDSIQATLLLEHVLVLEQPASGMEQHQIA